MKLTFRGETTLPIAYNAVALESDEGTSSTSGTGYRESVQKKLHELVEITEVCHNDVCSGVTFSYDTGSAICSSSSLFADVVCIFSSSKINKELNFWTKLYVYYVTETKISLNIFFLNKNFTFVKA